VLHTFLPIEKKREPNTWLIVDRIRRDFQHIRISIPKVNLKSTDLEHVYFDSLQRVELNDWGISELEEGVPTPIEKIDMVIVPLLAFDQSGHRIGFGKGYYDKFLAKCRKDARKVGLSFFPPELQIKGLESHDIALDCCITPYRMYNF
jgi:5-formyltetrahydrofolate cyclo-ligase